MLFNPLSGWVSDSAQVCVCVTDWVMDGFQPPPLPTLADYVFVWQVEKNPEWLHRGLIVNEWVNWLLTAFNKLFLFFLFFFSKTRCL